MAKKHPTVPPTPNASPKPSLTPAAVVLSEACTRLQEINRHLRAVDDVLAAIETDGDSWPTAIGIMVQAIAKDVDEVRAVFDSMIISGKDGSLVGIEKK